MVGLGGRVLVRGVEVEARFRGRRGRLFPFLSSTFRVPGLWLTTWVVVEEELVAGRRDEGNCGDVSSSRGGTMNNPQ